MTEIYVKDADVFESLMDGLYYYKLIELTKFVINLMGKMRITPVVTSAYRKDDTGVHKYGRGVDFRTHHITEDEIKTLCEVVNNRWVYDPKRPEKVCLMYHNVGKGPHLHLQAHQNTIERNKL